MALFKKKKDKMSRKDKKAARAERKRSKEALKKGAGGGPTTTKVSAEDPLKKPDWMRTSSVEIERVERAIDHGAQRSSRSNILKMYEERYGEELEAPAFSAGLQYEYQLYEKKDVIGKRDLDWLEDGKNTKAKETKPVKEKGGFFKRKKAAKEKPEGHLKVKEAVPMPQAPPESGSNQEVPQEQAVKAPGFFAANRPISTKSILMCLFVGKPMFPITGFVMYKARERKKWMWALVLVDLGIFIVPLSIILLRLWTRLAFEAYSFPIKSKAKKYGIDPREYDSLKELKEDALEAEEEEMERLAEEKAAKKKVKKAAKA